MRLYQNFLDIRNSMSHMYSEYVSWNSFEYIKINHKEIKKLIKKLEENLKK